ncbi:MAG: hypothetical protein JSW29_03770 [Candidatus Bathyarchaeota archaeon]|nr:MAG: hypothetical protein JSW29_03770 [Candidatus Bathyarchaeota archaeon]
MIAAALLGPWLFYLFQFDELTITWLGSFIVKGIGFPFFISGIIGLLALALPLVFLEEPPRKSETSAP